MRSATETAQLIPPCIYQPHCRLGMVYFWCSLPQDGRRFPGRLDAGGLEHVQRGSVVSASAGLSVADSASMLYSIDSGTYLAMRVL